MQEKTVRLSVPAEAGYARAVRMMASNLAVVCCMSVDDVEDVRMAAEEGFVYSCATAPAVCDITFTLSEGSVAMDFALGDAEPEVIEAAGVDLTLAELLLQAVCDDFAVTGGGVLHLEKTVGAAHV